MPPSLCRSVTLYSSVEEGVELQAVRCVRNAGHPGDHYGAAYDREGNLVKVFWH